MRSLTKQEQAAIEAVARRFSAAWEKGPGAPAAYITAGGKRILLEFAALKLPGSVRGAHAKPHLRFDKEATRLVHDLQSALHEAVPQGVAVLVAVTAPIRLGSKTTHALESKVRALLGRRTHRIEEKATIHGNRTRITFAKAGPNSAQRVIGFVHNPETDPRLLFEMTRALLALFHRAPAPRSQLKPSAERWLVVIDAGSLALLHAYRYIYSQLGPSTQFNKIVMVFDDARVETLLEGLR